MPALLVLLISAWPLVAAPWPVPNGDFEQRNAQGAPVGWGFSTHDGGDYLRLVVTEQGNSFTRIEGRAEGGRAALSQLLPPCPAPPAFRVRLRYRGTTSQMDGFVRLRDAAAPDRELSFHPWTVRPNAAEWTWFERDFAVPAAARAALVRAEIILYGRGRGTVDYDEVTMESLPAYQPTWPAEQALAMPFRPRHQRLSTQNPPDFSWPAVDGADGYDLELARDAGFATVARRAEGLTANFHNFAEPLEPGLWYWRVRFRAGENVSAWTEPRRFRLDPDAVPFPVPPVDELLARVPAGHPRVWTSSGELAAFRARAQGPRKAWFENLLAAVRADVRPPAPEPTFAFKPGAPMTAEWIAAHNKLRGEGEGAAGRLHRAAFAYLVSGDAEVGRQAVAQLLNLAAWDHNGATGYSTHDQVHRAIAYESAMAYDWLAPLLTPAERDQVLAMIGARTRTMFEHLVVRRPLSANPYDSHGWTAFGYVGIIAIATLGDLPEAEAWFRAVVPTYINLLAPWGDEEGGWAQGVDYWQYSQGSNREFMDVLRSATGFDLYRKAFARNNAYFPLYAHPHGSPRSHFGDGNDAVPTDYHIEHYRRAAQVYQDPILQWAWQVIGDRPAGGLRYFAAGADDLPARPPVELPPSHWFRDIDWVTMHSDLADPERVSFYFKSSGYGSFNHSHADQNSFVLNAYGEALAIDSGYYDWYGSPHDRSYTRHTLAHNAVTYDGGQGQPIFDITAKGRILGFVTHPAFDATSGDATGAYHGGLQRSLRHVIYLRPATFVVVDDLAAPEGAPRRFEWWLHALRSLEVDPDSRGASITQGKAALRVRFHEPAALEAQVRSTFVGPPAAYDGRPPEPVRPQGRGERWPDQLHACFATPASDATLVVTTLRATRASEAPAAVVAEEAAGARVLRFADGSVVVVRLGSGPVDAAGLSFDGAAAARRGDAVLLVEGTRLAVNGAETVSASGPVTVAVGGGEASVSNLADTSLTLALDGITRIRDARGRELERDCWRTEDGLLRLNLEAGSHTLRFNDTPAPGPLPPVELPVEGLAVPTLRLDAARGTDGRSLAWGRLILEEGLYRVEQAPAGLRLAGREPSGEPLWLGPATSLEIRGEPAPLRLARLSPKPAEAVLSETEVEPAVRLEAEAFGPSGGAALSRYTNRPFLSGGIGVGNWQHRGQWLSWRIEVPRAGRYDLLLKVATHTGASRWVALGDQAWQWRLPATPGYGATPAEWRPARIKLDLPLAAGPVTVTAGALDGLLNLDWVGLAPSAP